MRGAKSGIVSGTVEKSEISRDLAEAALGKEQTLYGFLFAVPSFTNAWHRFSRASADCVDGETEKRTP
jgi:hypothetical protein